MNHLSHAILSFRNEKIMVGQFLGDAVRGRDYEFFEDEIRLGILLHRWIDSNLDAFSFIQCIRNEIRGEIGLYSPVVIDVLLDHFRAKFFTDLELGTLSEFQNKWWNSLHPYELFMSKRLLGYFQAMPKYKWFQTYSSSEGTQEVLFQMSLRLPNAEGLRLALTLLPNLVDKFESDYPQFWSEFEEVFSKIQNDYVQQLGK